MPGSSQNETTRLRNLSFTLVLLSMGREKLGVATSIGFPMVFTKTLVTALATAATGDPGELGRSPLTSGLTRAPQGFPRLALSVVQSVLGTLAGLFAVLAPPAGAKHNQWLR